VKTFEGGLPFRSLKGWAASGEVADFSGTGTPACAYEAVAQSIAAIRGNEWAAGILGMNVVKASASQRCLSEVKLAADHREMSAAIPRASMCRRGRTR
jgi:hypothetical protein